jgi:hypothetical protein
MYANVSTSKEVRLFPERKFVRPSTVSKASVWLPLAYLVFLTTSILSSEDRVDFLLRVSSGISRLMDRSGYTSTFNFAFSNFFSEIGFSIYFLSSISFTVVGYFSVFIYSNYSLISVCRSFLCFAICINSRSLWGAASTMGAFSIVNSIPWSTFNYMRHLCKASSTC